MSKGGFLKVLAHTGRSGRLCAIGSYDEGIKFGEPLRP